MNALAATGPTRVGRRVDELETPALVVDLERLQRNLERAARYCEDYGLALLPHAKTHKTLGIAARQLALGADGLTVAKSEEAEIFAAALQARLLIHYPVLGEAKVERLVEVAARVPLTIAVDSLAAAEPLAGALARRGIEAEALIEIDVGLARTGLDPGGALALAQAIDGLAGLSVGGISCYPGHLRHDDAEIATGIEQVAGVLVEALALFESAGIAAARVSGGSTATLLRSHLTPMTELRPGNYALLDRNEAHGAFGLDDAALRVHATVVSTAVPGRFVLDAGSKTLSEAAPPPGASGHAAVVGREGLELVALSEEHGHGKIAPGASPVAVGDRLELIPNHACTCVNLHDRLYLAGDGIVAEELPIVARGAVR